jgi:chemotaxis protein MotB
MMAFFMLMWLLNATTEKQRKGIADYFSPTLPINRISGGGDGMFGGDTVFSEDAYPRNGTGASNRHPTESNKARGSDPTATPADNGKAEENWEIFQDMLMGRGGESTIEKDLFQHITTRLTDEGLVIELFDLPDRELFAGDTDIEMPRLGHLLAAVGQVLEDTDNKLAIGAHVKSYPVVLAHNPGWPLSSLRAQRVRVLLAQTGIGSDRIRRVTGHGDTRAEPAQPLSVINNRLEIILLRPEK